MTFLTGTNAELIYANTAAGTAKASFTSELAINDTTGMGAQPSLPPFFLATTPTTTGKTLHIIARGILSSTGTPTYTFTLRWPCVTTVWPVSTVMPCERWAVVAYPNSTEAST
ncbi:hypothetical protein ACX80V_16940 [Arthrobacter sp. MDT3-24]